VRRLEPILTAAAFRRLGEAMYGPQWQTPMARAIGVTDRTVRYMAAGERGIHEGTVAALVPAILDRVAFMSATADRLRRTLEEE